jgi:hypothetical protein
VRTLARARALARARTPNPRARTRAARAPATGGGEEESTRRRHHGGGQKLDEERGRLREAVRIGLTYAAGPTCRRGEKDRRRWAMVAGFTTDRVDGSVSQFLVVEKRNRLPGANLGYLVIGSNMY